MLLTIKEFGPLVNEKINNIFEEEKKRASGVIPFLPDHLEYFEKLTTTNGKKLRAYLIYLGYHLFKESEDNEEEFGDLLNLAAAIEIFHTAILIHDDIADRSEVRRSLKTFHKFEEEIFKNEHIAQSVAMEFGDFGLYFAQDIITRLSSVNNSEVNSILHEFNRIALDLAYGQIYDIVSNYEILKSLSIEELLKIYNLKTGTYTFLLPLKMGIIASKNEDKIDRINSFSENAGIVFQITDDLLDVFADPSKTGKPCCNDLKEGKINSIIRITLDTANLEDKKYIESILAGANIIDPERIRGIISKPITKNIIDTQLNDYVKKAIDDANGIEGNEVIIQILINLVNSFPSREK